MLEKNERGSPGGAGKSDGTRSGIGERIRRVRGPRSRDAFAAAVGVSRNTLMRYESGARRPDSEFLCRVCGRFQANPAWLLLGEGPICALTAAQRRVADLFGTSSRHPELAGKPIGLRAAAFAAAYNDREVRELPEWVYRELPEVTGYDLLHWAHMAGDASEPAPSDAGVEAFAEEFARVPFYDVEVSAGHGAAIDQELSVARLAFRRDWLKEMGLRADKVAAILASGDSMEHTIRDGDVLLVDRAQRQVVKDAIYVIRQDGLLYVKRLQRLYDGSLRVSSDNPAYGVEVVPKKDLDFLEVIGRVVWSGGRL